GPRRVQGVRRSGRGRREDPAARRAVRARAHRRAAGSRCLRPVRGARIGEATHGRRRDRPRRRAAARRRSTASVVPRAARDGGARRAGGLSDTLLDLLASEGSIVRTSTTMRLATHRVALEERADDVRTLLERISGEHEALPPTVKELLHAGTPRDVIDAASRAGNVVRISPELVVAPALVDRAVALVHQHAADGITVSTLREELRTRRNV